MVDPAPSYDKVRACAKNWEQYFPFHGLYALTGEGDSLELLLADDGLIYRVDTTDAFPLGNFQLDLAGVDREFGGHNPQAAVREQLLGMDFSKILDTAWCDPLLKQCAQEDPEHYRLFLEPFARLPAIPSGTIDQFLHTLCMVYPDFIGEFFQRYLRSLQRQCYEYWRARR